MPRWAGKQARRGDGGSPLLRAGRAGREWQEGCSAAQTGPPVGGEIDGHDSRRQSGGGGAGLGGMLASCVGAGFGLGQPNEIVERGAILEWAGLKGYLLGLTVLMPKCSYRNLDDFSKKKGNVDEIRFAS